MISCLGPFLNTVIQGELANILVDGKYLSGEEFTSDINKLANLYLTIIIIFFVFASLQWTLESFFLPQFSRDLRTAILKALLNQDIDFYDQTETGIITSRITEDAENAYNAYTLSLVSLMRCLTQWVAGVVICCSKSVKFTLLLMLVAPIYMLVKKVGDKKLDDLWLSYNDSSVDVSSKSVEVLTSFRTVRSFDAEMKEYKIYKEKLDVVYQIMKKNSVIHGIREFVSSFILWGSAALILYVTGIKAARNELEPGTIVIFMSIINMMNNSFAGIFSILADFKKSNVSSAKINEIIEHEVKIKRNEGNEISDVKGRIEFRDVTFTYATRDKPALDHLSFVVEPNTTVAIVGESGCGKSTTLQLLERFYDTDEGMILVDGQNIKEIAPSSLRKQIAFVPQTPIMFTMSIKNNIRFGAAGSHHDDIIHAAKVANAHDFIVQQPKGYNTQVHQNSLSGGQKQRLCIARAIIKDSPIILLDEATAALDAESEHLVQQAISDYRVGKTVIIVAHRLSTVMHSDKILVMSQGKIIEQGTHDELLQKGGAYADLVKNQLQ